MLESKSDLKFDRYPNLSRDGWTNQTLVEQLSGAMAVINTIAQERGLAHFTEVIYYNQIFWNL